MNYKLLEAEAKNGARLLSEKLKLSNNYEETKEILDDFCVFINRYASKKNDRTNKSLTALSKYYQAHREEITEINRKRKIQRRHWKDYIPVFIKLHDKGYSNPKISEIMLEKFKVKVSKETIRKALKDVQR